MERRFLKYSDYGLLAAVCLLMVASLPLIGSASRAMSIELGDPLQYVKRQAVSIILGLIIMLIFILLDYKQLEYFSNIIYLFNLAMLAAVLFFGNEAKGAQSWLGYGAFRFQPSEFAKIALIITLATHFARREGKWGGWLDFIPPMLHVAPPMLLILLQPDLGTALVFLAIMFGMMFVSGAPIRQYLTILLGGLASVIMAIVLHFKIGFPLPLKDYQLMRLIVFVNPKVDPLRAGYHLNQSKIAIGSGRILGKGLASGTQNRLRFLPEQHTDFIFSVVGEELGFIGAMAILGLYFYILWRGLRIAAEAKDLYGTLLATGVVSMLGFHVLVNVGMTIGIMPITGIPLPFLSYGGSSLMANMLGIGLLLNVYMRRQKILF